MRTRHATLDDPAPYTVLTEQGCPELGCYEPDESSEQECENDAVLQYEEDEGCVAEYGELPGLAGRAASGIASPRIAPIAAGPAPLRNARGPVSRRRRSKWRALERTNERWCERDEPGE